MTVQGPVSKSMSDLTVRQLKDSWGGRLPTWEEFKEVNRAGRVQADYAIARQLIFANMMPKRYTVIFGMVIVPFALLVIPITIGAYFWGAVGGWWILGAVMLAALLMKIAAQGSCEAMKAAANRSENLYASLVSQGAFQFKPLVR